MQSKNPKTPQTEKQNIQERELKNLRQRKRTNRFEANISLRYFKNSSSHLDIDESHFHLIE